MPDGEEGDELRRALEPLSRVGADLGKRAYAFVHGGEDALVLQDLAKHRGDAGEWLGRPGSGTTMLFGNNYTANQLGEGSLKLRGEFYRGLRNEHWQVLRRLGQVMAAADQGCSLRRTGGSRIPEWLHYLLSDALTVVQEGWGSRPPLEEALPWLSLVALDRALREEGLDGSLCLDFVFGRLQVPNTLKLDPLLGLMGLDAYLLAHPEAVASLATHLDAQGRAVLAGRLGGLPLVETYGEILVLLAMDDSRQVRAASLQGLEAIEPSQRVAFLGRVLVEGKASHKLRAIDLLGSLGGEAGAILLQTALSEAHNQGLRQALQRALDALASGPTALQVEVSNLPPLHVLPEMQLQAEVITWLSEHHRDLVEGRRRAAEREAEENRTRQHPWTQEKEQYEHLKGIRESDLVRIVDKLNGLEKGGFSHDEREIVGHRGRILARPDFGIDQVLRLISGSPRPLSHFWDQAEFRQCRAHRGPESLELRQLEEAFLRGGHPIEAIAMACLEESYFRWPTLLEDLPPVSIWPFFAAHPEFLEQGLGLVLCPHGRMSQALTLEVIRCFPGLPPRLVNALLTLALGEGKTHRAEAQEALRRVPGIELRIMEALQSTKGEVRAVAAEWLGALGCTGAAPALRAALAKEARETVRAALLTALEALGEDLSEHLGPERLHLEACSGLKAKPPKGLEWFPFNAMPTLRWRSGEAVAPEVLQWWITLACKLKQPAATPLLQRYLGLLEPSDRERLGVFILKAFIAQDTLSPTLAEAQAYARAEAPRHLAFYQGFSSAPGSVGLPANLEEMVLERLKKEHLGVYLGSAIGEKGILALIWGAPAVEVVALVRGFMRDHPTRRGQIEAMLEALSVMDQPPAIQLLLGVARRHRTASIQAKAQQLVQDLAERQGWTPEELEDRTVPTAGFGDPGPQVLDFGPRHFVLTLTGDLKLELRNADGKLLSSLPEPNKTDDPEKSREAKAQFNLCKKELRQVVGLQQARLYESMCVQRTWSVAEWKEFVFSHPIVGRLAQHLVWMDGTGQSFRPLEDGSLLDLKDRDLPEVVGGVHLAHAILLAPADAAQWRQHFKDYKVKPLFPQMDRPAQLPHLEEGQIEISDRLGWVSNAFTLRTAFTKLGYQRVPIQDWGVYDAYFKDFARAGIKVYIGFTGNTLPESNVPVALKTMAFLGQKGRRNHPNREVPLREVPRVLLAEVYGNYLTLGKACRGFDPGWASLVP